MEKKTIGAFIAALRKANGLTQKQLAEKLNVSDKAVSRWERDEAMPDLSLIPVLAEIFGVTSDEILRGERRSPDAFSARAEEKSEKQRRHLLADRKTKYSIRTTVSIGLAILGLIAAMICNFGFNRAYIGFLVGMVFYLTAAVCQVIFVILNLSGLEEDLLPEDALPQHRQHTVKLAAITATAIITLIAVSIPLVLFPWDTYLGLEAGTWFLYGAIYGAISLVICWILSCVLNLILAKRGFLIAESRTLALQKLRLRFTGIFTLVMIVLLIIQSFLNNILPDLLMTGTVFHDWDSFKTYMETPVESDGELAYTNNISIGQTGSFIIEEPVASIPSDTENVIYHEDGSVSYFPDYPTEQILAEDGSVICEFKLRNETVYSWSVDYAEDGSPVITVHTDYDRRAANLIMGDMVNPLYTLLYPVSAVIIFLIYRKNVKKIQ